MACGPLMLALVLALVAQAELPTVFYMKILKYIDQYLNYANNNRILEKKSKQN